LTLQFEYSPPTKDCYGEQRVCDEEDTMPHDFTQREFMPMKADSEISFNNSRNRSIKSPPKKMDR